jgi:hypothetical protein
LLSDIFKLDALNSRIEKVIMMKGMLGQMEAITVLTIINPTLPWLSHSMLNAPTKP